MKLTTRQRSRLAGSAFVFPRGTQAHPGRRAFPIENVSHGRAALSRAAQPQVRLTAGERCEVVRKVCRRFPSIGGVCAGESSSPRLNRCPVRR